MLPAPSDGLEQLRRRAVGFAVTAQSAVGQKEVLMTFCRKDLFLLVKSIRLVDPQGAIREPRTSVGLLKQPSDVFCGHSPGSLADDRLSLSHCCPDNVLEGFRR